MNGRFVGLALGLLAMGGAAFAQTDENAPIIVRAPSASQESQVRAFVGELTARMPTGSTMPRWEDPLCLGALGMQPTHARAMNDRIGDIARTVGLDVAAPGCQPNVLIYFTHEPDMVAQNIASRGTIVSANNEHGASLGADALQNFTASSRPVRWWHVSMSSTTDGFGIDRDSRQSGVVSANNDSETPASAAPDGYDPREPGASATNAVRVRDASRLRANVQQNLDRVVIIIDAGRVGDVLFGSLVDYVAMVTLAQINPDANVNQLPSILNLFSETSNVNANELTEWDEAYLRGLYRAQANSRTARDQERQIVRTMMRSEAEVQSAEVPEPDASSAEPTGSRKRR